MLQPIARKVARQTQLGDHWSIQKRKRQPLPDAILHSIDIWTRIVSFVGIVNALFYQLPRLNRTLARTCRRHSLWRTVDFSTTFQSHVSPRFTDQWNLPKIPPQLDWIRFVRFVLMRCCATNTQRLVLRAFPTELPLHVVHLVALLHLPLLEHVDMRHVVIIDAENTHCIREWLRFRHRQPNVRWDCRRSRWQSIDDSQGTLYDPVGRRRLSFALKQESRMNEWRHVSVVCSHGAMVRDYQLMAECHRCHTWIDLENDIQRDAQIQQCDGCGNTYCQRGDCGTKWISVLSCQLCLQVYEDSSDSDADKQRPVRLCGECMDRFGYAWCAGCGDSNLCRKCAELRKCPGCQRSFCGKELCLTLNRGLLHPLWPEQQHESQCCFSCEL